MQFSHHAEGNVHGVAVFCDGLTDMLGDVMLGIGDERAVEGRVETSGCNDEAVKSGGDKLFEGDVVTQPVLRERDDIALIGLDESVACADVSLLDAHAQLHFFFMGKRFCVLGVDFLKVSIECFRTAVGDADDFSHKQTILKIND